MVSTEQKGAHQKMLFKALFFLAFFPCLFLDFTLCFCNVPQIVLFAAKDLARLRFEAKKARENRSDFARQHSVAVHIGDAPGCSDHEIPILWHPATQTSM